MEIIALARPIAASSRIMGCNTARTDRLLRVETYNIIRAQQTVTNQTYFLDIGLSFDASLEVSGGCVLISCMAVVVCLGGEG